MSKERARRREAREAEALVRAQAREAASAREARKRSRRATWSGRLQPFIGPLLSAPVGAQTGPLARRRRLRMNLIVTALIFAQVLIWIIRPDWQARLAGLVLAALAFPVIAAFAL